MASKSFSWFTFAFFMNKNNNITKNKNKNVYFTFYRNRIKLDVEIVLRFFYLCKIRITIISMCFNQSKTQNIMQFLGTTDSFVIMSIRFDWNRQLICLKYYKIDRFSQYNFKIPKKKTRNHHHHLHFKYIFVCCILVVCILVGVVYHMFICSCD